MHKKDKIKIISAFVLITLPLSIYWITGEKSFLLKIISLLSLFLWIVIMFLINKYVKKINIFFVYSKKYITLYFINYSNENRNSKIL